MIQDNTTKWKVRKFTDFASNQAMPLGYVHWSISPIVPAGELPLLGGTYDRSLYADLWSWANENGLVISESEWQAMATAQGGSCSKFSDGNGSTTFRVPALKCWVKGANSADEVGNYLEAGLPNITGTFGRCVRTGTTNGAFERYSDSTTSNIGGNGSTNSSITFDASLSNAIYGNSDTVQPPSLVGQWLIVAFGVAHNIGEADVANVMHAVEQVQTGLGKVDGIADYIVESYRNGTEWHRKWKSGWVEQGGYKGSTSTWTTITLHKAFSDTNYTVLTTVSLDVGNHSSPVRNKTTTNFQTFQDYDISWYACGQGA